MNSRRQRGATLATGLMLLSLATLLGLAGASSARVELQLARNEQFRENAASAASAGIETAISAIVNSALPEAVPASTSEVFAGADRFDTRIRLLGYDAALPQRAGANLAGAHFEIISTGHSAQRAFDRQRALVLHVVPAPEAGSHADCSPAAPQVRCYEAGELQRLSWQRLPAP